MCCVDWWCDCGLSVVVVMYMIWLWVVLMCVGCLLLCSLVGGWYGLVCIWFLGYVSLCAGCG